MDTNKIKAVEIFTGTIWQAEILKSLLESANIEAFLQDEYIGTLNLPWASPISPGLVKVIISSQDVDAATSIIKDFEKNLEENT